ncbi:hypothetical protein OE88DRAFT_242538 [Heliocybe sulcata]|uniref:Uncharacterized protein n=1 Tax=Heliocybe sulcata TaxID=5364 RepID=A0A5C3N1Q7_9AGAM|nr:hypothetical protein OE88DRAFT_242538 [Heliocybe sulcata]
MIVVIGLRVLGEIRCVRPRRFGSALSPSECKFLASTLDLNFNPGDILRLGIVYTSLPDFIRVSPFGTSDVRLDDPGARACLGTYLCTSCGMRTGRFRSGMFGRAAKRAPVVSSSSNAQRERCCLISCGYAVLYTRNLSISQSVGYSVNTPRTLRLAIKDDAPKVHC